MNKISHKQAIQWIDRRLDGLLTKKQRLSLEEHLHLCDSCRAYAAEMDLLPTQLQNEFHARWDEKPGPSPKIMQHVSAQARNIPMTNRISSGIKLSAGAVTLIVLAFAINFVVSQLQSTSVTAPGTETVNTLQQTEDRLLAFASDRTGDSDIYTMRADGSGLTNLTNDPAYDSSPFWSPDGKRIAFESNRSGTSQVYLMDIDGSNVTQLTTDEAAHYLPMNIDGTTYPWSPDGSKLLVLRDDPGEQAWTLISQDIKDGGKLSLASGQLYYNGISWSPNGKYIGYLLDASPNSPPLVPAIHIIDTNGNDARDLEKVAPHTERLDSRYRWSSDGESIIFTTVRSDPAHATSATIVYEYEPDSNTLLQKDNLKEMGDWEDSQHLVTEFRAFERSELISVWQYPDGKGNLLDVDAQCMELNIRRSPLGNLAVAVYCPDDQFRLYWANTDGSTIKQLLSLPVDAAVGSPANIIWSPDDRYITFSLASSNQSNVYIVDTEKALADPSTQPVQVLSSEDTDHSMPSWQPVLNQQVVEEEPTPQPTPQAEAGVLAFASIQNGNSDIYTMRADGSGLTNLTNDPAYDSSPFWSPDGKQIAFTSDRSGSTQIYLMDADGANVAQLTNDAGISFFDVNGYTPWSPDGSKLIFGSKAPEERFWKLYVLNIYERTNIELTSEPGEYLFPSWSPDGEHVAFTSSPSSGIPRDIFVVGKTGNNLTNLMETLPDGTIYTFGSYSWSQDGKSIIFTADINTFDREAWQANYKSTVYRASPDGSLTIVTSVDNPILDWWGGTALLRDIEGKPSFTWLRSDGSQSSLDLCGNKDQSADIIAYKRSYDGNLVLGANCSVGGWMLYWANPDGTVTSKLMDSLIPVRNDILFNIAWSPDDHFLTFVSLDSDSSNVTSTLYVLDIEQARNDPSIQPLKMETSSSPSWRPIINNDIVEQKPTSTETPLPSEQADARLIAFTAAAENGNLEIYTMHADGSKLTNLTNNTAQDVSPVWSPDGKRLAFESDRNGYRQIFLMDVDGSNVVQLNENEEEADQWIGEPFNLSLNLWSPDGNKLIFYEVAPGDENGMLYIIDANGENKQPLVNETGKYFSPSWSPDGKHIAFIAMENSVARIYVTDPNGDNLTNITKALPSNETLYPMQYSWSRDGQSIAFIASNWNYLLGRGNEGASIYKWTAYEAGLEGNTLVANASADSQMGGYWDGTYFLSGSAAVSSSPEFKWVHSAGTSTTANPIENCQKLLDSNTGRFIAGYSSYKQSSNGNVVIGAYCPNGDKWLFWANSEGIFISLLNSPIHVQSIPSNAMHLWAPPDFIWSSDDKYIAFNIFSSGKTDLYIVNVSDALQNPSIQPFYIAIGNTSSLYYSPVWQPIP